MATIVTKEDLAAANFCTLKRVMKQIRIVGIGWRKKTASNLIMLTLSYVTVVIKINAMLKIK